MYNNLFIPPQEILTFSLNDKKTWTKKQAIAYAAWLENEKHRRIQYFCDFFKIDLTTISNPTKTDECLMELERKIVEECENNTDYYTLEKREVPQLNKILTEIKLTSRGYAMAADLGLFMYDLGFRMLKINKRLEANVKIGKKFVTYNLPVYFDSEVDGSDPVLSGKAYFERMLRNEQNVLLNFKKNILDNYGPNRVDPRAILRELGLDD